jgi:hypothetical protein
MKYRLLIGLIASALVLPGFQCRKNGIGCHPPTECYKGRLEIAGICRNFTIKVLDGNVDPSRIEASWTDPNTKTTYQNVFALGNYCSFPDDIKQGDEFYFTITNQPDSNCVTCMAYYPTPSKKLCIAVQKSGCGN